MCVFVQLACVPVFNLDEAQDAMSFRINYEIDSSQWGGFRGKAAAVHLVCSIVCMYTGIPVWPVAGV